MGTVNAYESEHMTCVLGDTLRPGGFELTDKAVNYCSFSNGDSVLDIGCGRGATVEHLEECFSLKAFGVDPSKLLLSEGKNRNSDLNIISGTGEDIPFENESMEGVFAECTLSLMNDLDAAIGEAHRVLKRSGWFVITDVYAREPEHIKLLQEFSFNSCMRGLHDVEILKGKLKAQGLEVMLFEDYTDLLRQLMVKIIFEYGSMNIFWSKAASCSSNCEQFQKVLSKCKVGYFLMIARKGEDQ